MISTFIENVAFVQAALLGCSLSVAALASVRGHHGQVTKQISQGVTIDRQAKNRKELACPHIQLIFTWIYLLQSKIKMRML